MLGPRQSVRAPQSKIATGVAAKPVEASESTSWTSSEAASGRTNGWGMGGLPFQETTVKC